jgi:hypothetical protein
LHLIRVNTNLQKITQSRHTMYLTDGPEFRKLNAHITADKSTGCVLLTVIHSSISPLLATLITSFLHVSTLSHFIPHRSTRECKEVRRCLNALDDLQSVCSQRQGCGRRTSLAILINTHFNIAPHTQLSPMIQNTKLLWLSEVVL